MEGCFVGFDSHDADKRRKIAGTGDDSISRRDGNEDADAHDARCGMPRQREDAVAPRGMQPPAGESRRS